MLFIILLISNLVLFNCASQGVLSGGPEDKSPPSMNSVKPENGSIGINKNQNISIYFDELIDPASMRFAIIIYSRELGLLESQQYKLICKGKILTIKPINNWPEGIIEIKVLRNLSDYRGNSLDSPIRLVYNTLNKNITNKKIKGKVINSKKGSCNIALYKHPFTFDSKVIAETQCSKDGSFIFNYLNSDKYIVVAMESPNMNNLDLKKHFSKYSIFSDIFIDLEQNFEASDIYLFLSEPWERLKIDNVKLVNSRCAQISLNNGHVTYQLIDEKEYLDSIKISLKLKNNYEEYEISTSLFVESPIDSTAPTINNYKIENNQLEINFSEIIKYNSEIKFIQQINDEAIILDFEGQKYYDGNFAHSIVLKNVLPIESIISFNSNNITDFVGNYIIQDSIKISNNIIIDKIKLSNTGKIFGNIIYKGENRIIIEAREIGTDKKYYTEIERNDFILVGLGTGFYKLFAYEKLNMNNTYFGGTFYPYRSSAKFSLLSETIEVRPNWDVMGVVLEIK